MSDLIKNDLKNSVKSKKLNYGRKLKSRIHLGVYLLQKMYDYKDRQVEQAIKDNAAYQIFCGYGIVGKWHCPDHTKIERFRSRLSPETQHQLANMVCKNAVRLGIAKASDINIDSTVQEANMTYPTDPKMLKKLGSIALKISEEFNKKGVKEKGMNVSIDIKKIASKARRCFFLKKRATIEEKTKVLSDLLNGVSEPVLEVLNNCKTLSASFIDTLSWPVKRSINQLLAHGKSYLESVKHFMDTGCAEVGKRLSFHLNDVACFGKKKDHKNYEFGRAFQLIRLAGNFLFVGKNRTVRMDDKKSFLTRVDEYEDYFGEGQLNSVTTDKGYYSINNIKGLKKRQVKQIGIQAPGHAKNHPIKLSDQEADSLRNRRAGIEPLIGHTKQGGQLGRSRMKNDRNIESSGYAAVLGFNLRQTIRALIKPKPALALL